jgi:hypothetical protein
MHPKEKGLLGTPHFRLDRGVDLPRIYFLAQVP